MTTLDAIRKIAKRESAMFEETAIHKHLAHLGASKSYCVERKLLNLLLRNSDMADTPNDKELKALNDKIQVEKDSKRLSALVARMIEVLDAKEKKVPVRQK